MKHVHNTLTVSCEKSKVVSFASSTMENTAVFTFGLRCRFSVRLICYVAFGSASRTCCLLEPIAMILYYFLKLE